MGEVESYIFRRGSPSASSDSNGRPGGRPAHCGDQGLRLQKRQVNGYIIKPKIFLGYRGRSTPCIGTVVGSTSGLMKEDRFLCPRFLLEYFPYKEFKTFNMSLGTNFIHKIVSTVITVI